MISEEDVIAFVDGRLEGPALQAFEERLKVDEDLVRRVAAHRWMARQIVAAYGSPPDTAVDEALIARLGLASDNVVALSDRRASAGRSRRGRAAQLGAIAASLAVGLLVGHFSVGPGTLLKADGRGRVLAAGALAEGLSDQLAGQAGSVRIGISFRTKDGICRTFRTDHGMSGLGCRAADGWIVPMVTSGESSTASSAEYRLAAGDVAPSVMAEVDRRIVGEPLSPAAEAKMKAAGWR